MKRAFCFFLVLTMLLAAVPAFASSIRYCPICDEMTTWRNTCSGNRYGASAYGKCGDQPNCNWYTLYRYDGEKCDSCRINKWTLSTYHGCKGIHSVRTPAHDYSWCPY